MEDILSGGKTWGIEDAVEQLEIEVEKLNLAIAVAKDRLDKLENQRNSLDIGLYILRDLVETRSSKESAKND